MCFDDHHHRYRRSHRRLGSRGPYYPEGYYARPPVGRLVPAMVFPHPHSQYGGYSGGGGGVAGGYSRGLVSRFLTPARPAFTSARVVPIAANRSGYGYLSRYGAGGGRASMPSGSAMRTYYHTAPSYGYTTHVYPPGPTATTTTYHVTNAQAPPYHHSAAQTPLRETRPAFTTYAHHGHPQSHPQSQPGPTREAIQLENRRVATARGAYDARKIRPADARDDDPFWCRERSGEWHLRSYYQIENECLPGRWMMDADVGFLVFYRE